MERPVGNKIIIWFEEPNRYMLVELPAYHVINRYLNGSGKQKIADWCRKTYHLPLKEARRFVDEVIDLLPSSPTTIVEKAASRQPFKKLVIHQKFNSRKFYDIYSTVYSVDYETEEMEMLIHPRIAHMAVKEAVSVHSFQIYMENNQMILAAEGFTVGKWNPDESHYLAGKFFVELLNRMYDRQEVDWMGVFHASAIRQGNRSVLFLGDSGSGKSTICAILMAHGFQLVADDLVPVEALSGKVFSFPAAVSVKSRALLNLASYYPQLLTATEFNYPGTGKTVRYLPPKGDDESGSGFSCQALILVKYRENSGCTLEEIPKDIAFSRIVPDSWISPLSGNAERFLDWFLALPCYGLTYSDNDLMVQTIQKLFQNELP